LPSVLSYGGTDYFSQLSTGVPEYYQSASGLRIIEHYGAHVADWLLSGSCPTQAFEHGIGRGDKTLALLQHLQATNASFQYVGIDCSRPALEAFGARVKPNTNGLVRLIHGNANTYIGPKLAEEPGTVILVMLGGELGNEENPAAKLDEYWHMLPPGGKLLVGYHNLDVPADRLLTSYNDPGGVTAMFILNALTVLKDTFGGDIDPSKFGYHVRLEPDGRIVMSARSLIAQRVAVGSTINQTLDLEVDELIRISTSWKWRRDDFRHMATQAGFRQDFCFSDKENLTYLVGLTKSQAA